MRALACLLIALTLLPANAMAQTSTAGPGGPAGTATRTGTPTASQILRIGVLSPEGATRALAAWEPTIEALNASAATQAAGVRFNLAPHSATSLNQALAEGHIDLMLSDPAFYVRAEVERAARALLSVAPMWDGQVLDHAGALIFTRADRPLRELHQLHGRSLMAVDPNDVGGWWLAEQAFRAKGMDPVTTLSELLFSGGDQREVVFAVQNGLVDAGVVRAGLLEEMAREGVIDMADFAPVSPQPVAGYPFWVSTGLFPSWVLSALPGVPDAALSALVTTLLSLPADSAAVQAAGGVAWRAPQNYRAVHDLLISLRAAPYEAYVMQAATRVFRSFRLPILIALAMIVASLMFLAFEMRRNSRAVAQGRSALQAESRKNRLFRDAVMDHAASFRLQPNGRFAEVNDRFCKIMGQQRQQLMSLCLFDLVPAAERDGLRNDMLTAMRKCAAWSGTLVVDKPGGSRIRMQCTCIPTLGSDNRLLEVSVVATAQGQARNGSGDDRYGDTLDQISEQVAVLRPDTFELLYCNRAASLRLVHERVGGNWRGRRVSDFITPEDLRALEIRRDMLIKGPARRMSWDVRTASGSDLEVTLEYVEPEYDEPRLIAIYRDISHRRVEDLAKTEFISTVSHELRTPLTSMKGALGLALSGSIGEMSDPVKKMVSMASSNCDRLVLLINDILDLEKIEAGKMDFKMAPLDLAELIDDAVAANRFYAERFGVTLHQQVAPDAADLMTLGDRNRLMQVMDNLLSNAAKFSSRGAEVMIWLRPYRGALRLSVRDFGTGIPLEARATIFDKFTQADSSDARARGGSGLGLSIARRIVEEHHGSIFFTSEEGAGTEFFVDLPQLKEDVLLAVEPHEAEAATPFTDIDGRNGPDQTAFRQLAQRMRQQGAQVTVGSGHLSAHQLVTQSAATVTGAGAGTTPRTALAEPAWFSPRCRDLLAMLRQRELVVDCPVAVIEAGPVANAASVAGAALTQVGLAALLTDWMGQLLLGQVLRVLQVEAESALPLNPHENVVVARVAEPSQAVTLASEDHFDLLMIETRDAETRVTALFPLSGGRLPADMPIILVVMKEEAPSQASARAGARLAHSAGSARDKALRWVAGS